MSETNRIIVGISGASGAIYGIRLLQMLRGAGLETHLVMSRTAEITVAHETDWKVDAVKALADFAHAPSDLAAPISSGSFRTRGMIVAPCSVRTLGEIATAISSSLLTRAADVVLKERRRLVLMVRETLCAAANDRCPGRSLGGARPRPVRHRGRRSAPLGRGKRAQAVATATLEQGPTRWNPVRRRSCDKASSLGRYPIKP
jgi:polyprenyl P-hydroxybenzoate/phenylacrylic acid decarboxylase-like protein